MILKILSRQQLVYLLMNYSFTLGLVTKVLVVNISINGTIESNLMLFLPVKVYRKALDQPIDDKLTLTLTL